MRRYSNVQALVLSFFARDVYRDAAWHWRGAGLLYALLLAAIVALLVAARIQIGVVTFADRDAPRLIAQLPTITIQRGEVRVDAPTPLEIRAPDSGRTLAIIDPSGTVTSLAGSEATVLLTRTHLLFRKSNTETRMFDLARIDHLVIDRTRARGWLRLVTTWLAALLFPFILLGLYAVRLIQQLIAAVVTLPIARSGRVTIDFAGAMRLAAVAITPPTLVLDLVGFSGVAVPFASGLWCVVALGYLLFAVRACGHRPEAVPMPEAPEIPSPPAAPIDRP